jgi:thioesterase domain-containing protein
MATNYVAEIRRVQPRGPYFLIGFSFGGWVAFEMAQQLVREGERVSFLGMIDTILLKPPMPSRAARLRCELQGLRGKQALPYVLMRVCKHLAFRMRTHKRAAALWPTRVWRRLFKRPLSHTQRSAHYEWLCIRARRQYVPQPYAGHLTIFGSAGNAEWHRLCWTPLEQGGLTVLEGPAGHDEMVLPPHSKRLAEKIDDCLNRLTSQREAMGQVISRAAIEFHPRGVPYHPT